MGAMVAPNGGCGEGSWMPEPVRLRSIAYGAPSVVCEKMLDGSIRYRSTECLAPYDPSLARLFRAAVERHPARLFLAERDAGAS